MGGVIVVIDIDEDVEEEFEEIQEVREEQDFNIYIKIQNIILNNNVSNTNINNNKNNVVIEKKGTKGSDPIPIPYNK
jgi:hypothetical protein